MKDIAGELGVSVALVSYVLNGKKTDKINDHTAAKIKSLAAKMNYSPNQIAKSLKTNHTFTLGLIVADISNLFYSSIAKYIEDEANLHGYHVIYGSAYEKPDRFHSILDLLLSRQVDGFILAIPEKAEHCIQLLTDLNQPFVVIDRKFDDFPNAPSIILNNLDASQKIVTHQVENGFKRLGLVTINRNLVHLQERKVGYINTCRLLLNQEPFVYEIEEERLEAQIRDVIHKSLFQDQVDSLCFFTNKVAMAGLSEIASIDIPVPGQLGIVCFDEAEAYKLFRTPITYLKQPLQEMSKAAIDYLLNQIDNNGNNLEKQLEEFKGALVINKSSVR
ncbi:MAG: LacI family DNA-binding transcriptional regulator [Niabella sp.]